MSTLDLDDRDVALAATAVEWYVRDGISDERVRAAVLGDAPDAELDAMKRLRARLRDAATQKVVVGRAAFDLLRSTPWSDPDALAAVENVRETATRVSVNAKPEVAALFAEVLSAAASEAVADGKTISARRYRAAAALFAAAAPAAA